MNYSRKKSDGVFTKLFSSLIKSVLVLSAAFMLCSNVDFAAEDADKGPVTVEIPYDVQVVSASPETEQASPETADDGFINPTEGVLTSSFGERWGRRHNGIDIGADMNTEIYAADSGTVTYAGEMSGYGNYVVIDHGNGFETAYAHCSSISVSAGDTVLKGQVIAHVGSTGNSTGPHLHFEVKENGEFLNPLDYVIY